MALILAQEKGNEKILADVSSIKGEYFLITSQNEKALKAYEEALSLYQKLGDLSGQGNVYQSKGDIYLYTGDNEAALKMHDKALALYKRIGDPESEAYALFGIARISDAEGRKDETVSLYEDALTRIEKVREKTGIPEMKRSFMEKVYDRYEEAAVFMLKNSYNPKAFQWTEAMKARVFLDQLAEGLVDLEKGISPGLKEKRDSIEERLSILSRQKMNEAQKKKPDEERKATLQGGIKKEEAALEDVKRQIRLKNPLYASVEYPVPITLNELRKKELKKEEAILEYLL